MFFLPLALLLAETTWISEGAFSFTQEPNSTVYIMKGSDAVLKWEFSVTDRLAELRFIIWRVVDTTDGNLKTMLFEDDKGVVQFSNTLPPAYNGRVNKTGNATIVIKNVDFGDATEYRCTLDGKNGLKVVSSVLLVVTGQASVHPMVGSPEVGGSATFTCNATGVPSQYFFWTQIREGQTEQHVKNDSHHLVIVSPGSSEVTIKNITEGDQGYYICYANISQQNSARGFVQVSYPARQDNTYCPTVSYCAPGKQLPICCPVSGYPPPIVTWEKNGIQLQKGGSTKFTINFVNDSDFGNYTCTAEAADGRNTIGPFNITVIKECGKAELLVTYTDEKLLWTAVPGAIYYTVEVNGRSLVGRELLIGTTTSVEFFYHTFVLKNAKEKPDEIPVCADVTAFSNERSVAQTPKCHHFTIKSNQVSVQPSVVCLLLLLSVNWKVW